MITASALARPLLLLLAAASLFAAVAALLGGAAQAQTGGMMEAEDGEGVPGFPYALSDQTWRRNAPISPLQFPASGCTGDVTHEVITQQTPGDRNTFVWRPPDGLTFNETTRLLSGAPTSPPGQQWLFYRARGSGNRDCGLFRITVTIVEGLEFARAIQPQKWTLGETVTLDLPRAAGGREPIRYELQSESSKLRIEITEPNELWLLTSAAAARGLVFKKQEHQLHGRVVAPPGAYALELSATDADGITGSTSFRVEIAIVSPQRTIQGVAAQRIAKIYAPVLLRDSSENFKPVSIDAMLELSALYQENPDDQDESRLIQPQGAVAETDLRLHDGQDVYLDLFASYGGSNEDEWEKVEEIDPPIYPATVYARVFMHGPQLVVQYWFFYVYNNAPGGTTFDHEGDWEGIQLVFSEATSRLLNAGGNLAAPPLPSWLGYASHDHGELRLPSETRWRNPRGALTSTAPVVYVAAGTHASYAYKVATRGGTRAFDKHLDIARGDHPAPLVEGSDYQLQLIRGDEQWLSWTGRWGKDHIHGPKVQGRRWTEPICWPGWRTNDQNEAAFAALRDC